MGAEEAVDLFIDANSNIDDADDLETSVNELATSLHGSAADRDDHIEHTAPLSSPGLNTDVCGICYKGFFHKQCRCIECDGCELWYHCSCVDIKSFNQYKKVSKKEVEWFCPECHESGISSKPAMRPYGLVTQTLDDLRNAPSHPDTSKPESPLSQYLRTSKESSPIFVETQ